MLPYEDTPETFAMDVARRAEMPEERGGVALTPNDAALVGDFGR